MDMQIKQFPIKPSVIITVFKGYEKYSLTSDGTVCYGDAVVSEFSNKRLRLSNHTLHQVGTEITTKKLSSFCKENNIESEKVGAETGEDILLDFLFKQGYDLTLNQTNNLRRVEKLFVILPKPYKKPKGKPFKNFFEVCAESFDYGSDLKVELDVYMTPITSEVKNIKFRVDIPDYIYNKCMENNDVERQPKLKYIESESLSFIHSTMSEYSSMAVSVFQEQKSSEKYIKKIVIDFNSHESAERDNYNFAYTGQKISTKFNWFIVYEYTSNGLLGGTRYFTFLKKESKFSSVSPKHGLQQDENGLVDLSLVNGKCYLNKPSGVIIDWTQEREDFFKEIENNFRKLSSNLNHFLSDLDSDKVDLLINNSNFKFLQ
jgi:hypothetical protein